MPLVCNQLYVQILDPCNSLSSIVHTSVNTINFRNTGWDCTKVVEAWNDGYAFGFYFGDVNAPDFKLRHRLRVLQFNPVYRNSGEEYLYSSGASGRSFAQSQKARTAWFDYVDEYAHDCIRTQLLSQKLFVDNYAFFFAAEDYEPEWNERGKYNLAQSKVTLIHEEAIFGSTCGVIGNAVCPPQVVPTPVQTYTQVQLKGEWTNAGFNFTNCAIVVGAYDETGTIIPPIGCSSGPYNLTIAGDRITCANDIICAIDYVFGTSCTGTVSVAGSTLTVDISGSYTGSNPSPVLSVAFYDTSSNYPAPIGTIPS
jgi:hypothetical protein